MVTLDVLTDVLVDGGYAPGFPHRQRLTCARVLVLRDNLTDLVNYKDILLGYLPSGTVSIKFLLLTFDKASQVALNDLTVPSAPMTLAANALCCFSGAAIPAVIAAANAAVRVRATITDTNMLAVVGID